MNLIFCELKENVEYAKPENLVHYTEASEFITDSMGELLDKQKVKAVEMVNDSIDAELTHFNFDYPLLKKLKQFCLHHHDCTEEDLKEIDFFMPPSVRKIFEDFSKDKFEYPAGEKFVYTNDIGEEFVESYVDSNSEVQQRVSNNFSNKNPIHCRFPEEIMHVSNQPSVREQEQVAIIKKLIVCYFELLKIKINDSVPKYVLLCLLSKTINGMFHFLITKLYNLSDKESLLKGDPEIEIKRQKFKKDIDALQQSLNKIKSFQSDSINNDSDFKMDGINDNVPVKNSKSLRKKSRVSASKAKRNNEDGEESVFANDE